MRDTTASNYSIYSLTGYTPRYNGLLESCVLGAGMRGSGRYGLPTGQILN